MSYGNLRISLFYIPPRSHSTAPTTQFSCRIKYGSCKLWRYSFRNTAEFFPIRPILHQIQLASYSILYVSTRVPEDRELRGRSPSQNQVTLQALPVLASYSLPLAVVTRQQAHQARAAIASIALPSRWISCPANRDRVYCCFTVVILERSPPVLSVHLAQKPLLEHEILRSGGNALITVRESTNHLAFVECGLRREHCCPGYKRSHRRRNNNASACRNATPNWGWHYGPRHYLGTMRDTALLSDMNVICLAWFDGNYSLR
jgi:hypothetical protein